jgi:L-ascorbate metabolism protein UlaG (beta-lactamase superfamily)
VRCVFTPARHVSSLVRWAANRKAQEREAAQVLDELHWDEARRARDLPPGLGIRWLGTAGYELTYEGYTLLIDPYVTRLPLADMVRRRVVPPDSATVAGRLPAADAVLIGHTHFDHVLDAPEVVRQHGCPVYGSGSVRTLLDLYGLADRAVVVEPYRRYELGPFTATFVPSVHSKLALGLFVPQGGALTCDSLDGLCPQAYGCDQVWGIHLEVDGCTLYHQGSADLIDDAVRHTGVDVFLCGIAGRQFSPAYVDRVLRRLQPNIVVPGHYDDFFRPLDAPMGFTVNLDVAGFVDEVRRFSRDIEVRALEVTGPVSTAS